MVDIEHRGKTQVHPVRPQLDRQDETRFDGQLPGVLRVGIPGATQLPHRWYCRETFAEALHPAPFMVDRNDKWRFAHGMDRARQLGQLLGVRVIPGKQDDASRQGMRKPPPVVRSQLRAGDIEHERTERKRFGAHLSSTTQAQARFCSSLIVK